MSWEYHSTKASPADVAAEFARTFSDEPRRVEALTGTWTRTTYTGTFRLVGGTRIYDLFGRNGHWSVAPAQTQDRPMTHQAGKRH